MDEQQELTSIEDHKLEEQDSSEEIKPEDADKVAGGIIPHL
jgi:hypothetical protein